MIYTLTHCCSPIVEKPLHQHLTTNIIATIWYLKTSRKSSTANIRRRKGSTRKSHPWPAHTATCLSTTSNHHLQITILQTVQPKTEDLDLGPAAQNLAAHSLQDTHQPVTLHLHPPCLHRMIFLHLQKCHHLQHTWHYLISTTMTISTIFNFNIWTFERFWRQLILVEQENFN
jgi:hypothetical protein